MLSVEELYDMNARLEATIEQQAREQDACFSILNGFGIPKERARSVQNGIMVFDSRMQREVSGLRRTIEQQAKVVEAARVALNQLNINAGSFAKNTLKRALEPPRGSEGSTPEERFWEDQENAELDKE